MRVIVVQHAEKRSDGPDPGITERGRRQALAVRALLGNPSNVTTSPLRRAMQTATIIADPVVPAVNGDLRERMEWLGAEHQPLAEFLAQWQRSTVDRSFRPLLGESSLDAGQRMRRALIAIAHAGMTRGPAVVVTHGGATVDLLRDLIGDAELEARAPGLITFGVPGGAITQFDWDGDMLAARSIGVIDHLDADDRTGHTR